MTTSAVKGSGAKPGRRDVEALQGTILYLKPMITDSGLANEKISWPPRKQQRSYNPQEHVSLVIRLECIIGTGTYSCVYRAVTPIPTSPHVAVKCVSLRQISLKSRKRQDQECQILKQLTGSEFHDRIVRLLQDCESDGITYLVFELAQTNLFNYLVGLEPPTLGASDMAVEEVDRLFMEFLEGIHGCHSLGIFHRDIKPENLLLHTESKSFSFHIKIADFGLATKLPKSNEFGCGSLRYMSMECLNSEKRVLLYDCEKNDVWSCAIVLVNMLCKKNPWNTPCRTDAHFKEHILEYPQQHLEVDRLQIVFDFSLEFCRILRQVFCKESSRISVERFAELLKSLNCDYFSSDHISVLSDPLPQQTETN